MTRRQGGDREHPPASFAPINQQSFSMNASAEDGLE